MNRQEMEKWLEEKIPLWYFNATYKRSVTEDELDTLIEALYRAWKEIDSLLKTSE